MGDLSVPAKSRRSRWLAAGLAIAAVAVVSGSTAANKYFHADQAAAGPAAPEQAVAVTVAVVKPRQTSLWDEFSGRLEAVDASTSARAWPAQFRGPVPRGRAGQGGRLAVHDRPGALRGRGRASPGAGRGREARAEFTKSELERAQQLIGDHVVTQRELDQRDNAYARPTPTCRPPKPRCRPRSSISTTPKCARRWPGASAGSRSRSAIWSPPAPARRC